ncbi:acetyl-coenzyme A transporter 1-like [Paramacrobiotus metropolitanus]|uniref:acetyl-coenzyme A transporter 1-like n=1 Tax=Paramacrobiotus metropolitanus TaxID=2943436 RepID=UPI002445BD65|nr:acetyl-coenzyme A transporter 1-like [Paramacrobiotus metropolitanus]XP_055335217.1 acetyl-coenzyme A transporter 1-like [Paramacrobiotus metropolitanus]
MSLPEWEEEASAQKTLLSINRNNLKRRAPLRPNHVGSAIPEVNSQSTILAPDIREDRWNVALLLFLYVLQGIPLGLGGSIPMILSSRHVSYHDQAFFSLVFWPFSLKLIWAPIIDSIYSKAFGRRKSWLIPTQYLIGIFMLILSLSVDSLLGRQPDGKNIIGATPSIVIITVIFFTLNFLASVQDIAVDGWALTMLAKRNVGYASTCNSVGQTAGYFIGNVMFLAFESADFCNKYIRDEPEATGMVTLPGFLWFWGFVFIISTTAVWIMKKEGDDDHDASEGVLSAYRTLLKILRLPSVIRLCLILLTSKVAFSAAEAVSGLKLIELGVHKEQLALLAVPMVPLQIILPVLISKYTAGPKPMNIFLKSYPCRLLMGLEFALVVWITPKMKLADGSFPAHYYGLILLSYAVHQIALYGMFVSVMGFFARISDPMIGGTYMTLLNTVYNLGGNWPNTLSLSLVDDLTWSSCQGGGASGMSCNQKSQKDVCAAGGGNCVVDLDGFYVEVMVCFAFGLIWYQFFRSRIRTLQELPERSWRLQVDDDK